MNNFEAVEHLIEKWYETKKWAEELICMEFHISEPMDMLKSEHRKLNMIGSSGWEYRIHGVGINIFKGNNKGGIDFDFDKDDPDVFRLRGFMIKQLNDGALTKKYYRDLLQDQGIWDKTTNMFPKLTGCIRDEKNLVNL